MVNLVTSANNFVKLDAFDLTFLKTFSPTPTPTSVVYGDSSGSVVFGGQGIASEISPIDASVVFTAGTFSTLTLTNLLSFPIAVQDFTTLNFTAARMNELIAALTAEAFREVFFRDADHLIGGDFADVLVGYGGADTLEGGGGDDKLYGGVASDTLKGGDGNDIMDGGAGVDSYAGGLGNDAYYVRNLGSNGRVEDTFSELAGQGIDGVNTSVTLNLNEARYNNIENGYLSGTAAINLGGSSVNNVLVGNSAANSIYGLGGRDIMQGGGGADKFVYLNVSDTGTTAAARDVIQDFTPGSDKIDLGAIDANGADAGDGMFSFQAASSAAFTGVAGQLHFLTSGANTIVKGDINGDKIADFQIELTGLKALHVTDFVL